MHRIYRTTKTAITIIATVLLALLIVLAAAGCRRETSKSILLGIGLDNSGSQNTPARDDAFVLMGASLDQAVPSGTMVSAWAFASPNNARKVWGPNPVRDPTDLSRMVSVFRTAPPEGPGTHVKPLLQQFVATAREARKRGQRVAFVILGDGEWSDYDAARPVAAALAQVGNVAAVLVGPIPENSYARSQMEDSLAALGPDRLIVCSKGEAGAALKRFRAACRKS